MLHSNLGPVPSEDACTAPLPCMYARNFNKMGPVTSSKQLQQEGNAKNGKNENVGLKTTSRVTAEPSKQALHMDASGDDEPLKKYRQGNGPISYTISGSSFTMDSRYRDLKAVGKGSYGLVCCARDTLTNKRVAIKKIQSMSKHAVNAKHVLREIRLMRHLSGHPNIITLQNIYVEHGNDELYLVMDLMDSDLHKIIQSPQPLSDAHFRYFMYQLLKGVRFLHENRIIHRDLKPGNLLVTKSCKLKITDFGLARVRPIGRGSNPDDAVDDPMTEHVVTRWYRPPELMLCPNGLYEYSVDLWSCGCIFAEMLGRSPIFPGRNFVDQLTLIFDVVGSPAPFEVEHICNPSALKFLHSMRGKQRKCFLHLFDNASPLAVDLLESLLVFDPPDRLTVHESISHIYFEPLWATDNVDVPLIQGLDFDFESQSLQVEGLKGLIVNEVDSFREEQYKLEQELRLASSVSKNDSMTTTAAAGGGGGGAGTAKSEQQSNGARRTRNNNSHNIYGGGKGETVQKSSSQMLAQRDIQSGASTISGQKNHNKCVSSPKYPRCDSQGDHHGSSSSTYNGSRLSENSNSLSTTTSQRFTCRGYAAASHGGDSVTTPAASSSNIKNVHELSDCMHRLQMRHEKQNSGNVHHTLVANANEATGTAQCNRKGKSDSDDIRRSYPGDVGCSGDSTIRSPTSTLHNNFYRVIAGNTSPLLKCSKQVDLGSHAVIDCIPSSCTSVGKPPTKQRRT